ncbi:MAG TPA: hypothetical protein VF384_01485 [Planctomycetota bacterium]
MKSPTPQAAGPSRLGIAGLAIAILSACQQTPGPAVRLDVSIAAPTPSAGQPVHFEGLHNVVTYTEDLVCGGVPEGEAGLRALAAMGIRTIVSVDGASPMVEAAASHGMRYVHLPISYDGVTPEQQLRLAQAVHSLPRPIYVHCHHGKHRSGSALGCAAVLGGDMTPEEAMSRMAVSGTAKEYGGLWQAVREGKALDDALLRADPASFPSVSKVSGLVATMAEIDRVFDYVKQTQKAGWSAPADHPDLVARKETQRLHVLFSQLPDDADSRQLPGEYQTLLREAVANAKALDAAVQANDIAAANRLFAVATASCKTCHKTWRDR